MTTRPTPEDLEHIRQTYPAETNYAVGLLLREIDALRAEVSLLRSAQAFLDEIEEHKARDVPQGWQRLFAWWKSKD